MNNHAKEQASPSGQAAFDVPASDGGQSASGRRLSYSEKLRLTDCDAARALAALGAVVVVWLVCGFGLSGFDVQVFHVPLWVVGGLLGTWAAAIIASVVLARSFKDFDLADDGESTEHASGESAARVSGESVEYTGAENAAHTGSEGGAGDD